MERPVSAIAGSIETLRRRFGLAVPQDAIGLDATWAELVGPGLAGLTESIEARGGALRIVMRDAAAVESARWRAAAIQVELHAAAPSATWDSVVVTAARRGVREPRE